MRTPRSPETAGAGPSAASSSEPEVHDGFRPAWRSWSSAAATSAGSGPNSAAYSAGVTVRPAARSFARPSGWRDLRVKLRSTTVASPAGPRSRACWIAWARLGAGVEGLLVTEPAGWRGATASGVPHAVAATTSAISTTRNFTGNVASQSGVAYVTPKASRRRPGHDLAHLRDGQADLRLEVGLHLVRVLQAHVARQRGHHMHVDVALALAELDIDAFAHLRM